MLWTEAALLLPEDEEQQEVVRALIELEIHAEDSVLAELFTLKSLKQISGSGSVHKGRGGHTARTLTRAKMSSDVGPNLDNVTPLRAFFAGLNLG